MTLEDPESGAARTYFVAPAAGGVELTVSGDSVVSVTPQAPIGRSLLGAHAGDEIRLQTPQGVREMEIVRVR